MEKIDFVVLWVDGNDPKWLAEKNRCKGIIETNSGNAANRYRDWDLLKYWFRGVETNASWVNKIHFVTYGHLPEWLDINHPKLNIVKHEDIIPEKYLPTFNSNVIQYYLTNIKGLTDRFIMFDDDQFILKKVESTEFFCGDKICDEYGENLIYPSQPNDPYPHSLLNNIQIVNKHYNKMQVYKKHPFKYFNLKYGLKNNIKTLCLLPWNDFAGFYNPHICQCYTKKHYDLFWKYCKEFLEENSYNQFRKRTDLTTFLIRYIALLEGDFVPRKHSFGIRMELGKNNKKIYEALINRKYKVLCINDSSMDIDFDTTKKELIECFEKIYPNKSKFEK